MNARRGLAAALVLLALQLACAGTVFGRAEDDEEPWREQETVLPAFPRTENLLPFDVSALTSHRYFIDADSIGVGADGVVRFTLVVETAGGSRNVSFEGIRCATLEHRLYATGRADGTWSKARAGEWKAIENKPVNRYHAALSRDYFCPGAPIRSAEEGRRALRLGRHPDAR